MPGFMVVRPLKRWRIIRGNPRFSSPPHRVEELGVGLGGLELVDEEFRRLQLVHREQQLSEHPHLLQDRLLDQQFLAPGARPVHIDGGIDALLVHAAVEVHLHVAGALELLVDHVVHAAAGVDERGGDDGERAAFLDVARRAEEALGLLQRIRVDAAGEDLPRGGHHGVVGARQARDRVEQDHHVLLVLDQALRLLDHHLGDLHVARGRLVEGRGHHLAAHRARHLGHLFRALVDQQHDQGHVGMVRHQGVRGVLQHHRLAGLGRADDQAALALADRRDDVEHAPGDVLLGLDVALELERLVRVQRRQVLEQDLVLRRLGQLAVDLVDLDQREVALAVLGRDRKSTRLNSSHQIISYAVFCLKKKKGAMVLRGDTTNNNASVVYFKNGQFFRATAKAVIFAGQSHTARTACEHLLSPSQANAFEQVTLSPVLTANVTLRSAAPIVDLGYDGYYWGSQYWADFVVADWVGPNRSNANRQTVLTFYGGNTATVEDQPNERIKLLTTPFSSYEDSLRAALNRVLAGANFA